MLTLEARERVDREISQAEAQSSVELVAVLAPRSADYLHVPYQGGIYGATLALAIATLIDWLVTGALPHWHIGWFVLITAGGFLAGALVTRITGIQRALAGREVLQHETEQRARQVFLEHAIFRTSARTGVLLYVSWFERIVIVLADDAVAAKLGPEALDGVVAVMMPHLEAGEIEAAFTAGVRHLGTLLSPHFPRAADDRNELPDRLYVLDD